jgi:hypothetical protein
MNKITHSRSQVLLNCSWFLGVKCRRHSAVPQLDVIPHVHYGVLSVQRLQSAAAVDAASAPPPTSVFAAAAVQLSLLCHHLNQWCSSPVEAAGSVVL